MNLFSDFFIFHHFPWFFALGIWVLLRPVLRSHSVARETVSQVDGNWREPQHLTRLDVSWPVLENPWWRPRSYKDILQSHISGICYTKRHRFPAHSSF